MNTTIAATEIDTRFRPVIVRNPGRGPATFSVRYQLVEGGHLDVPAANRQEAERAIQGL